jgi:hypothetical protein
MNSTKINCPGCGVEININEVMYHHLKTEMESKYAHDFQSKLEAVENEKKLLQAEKQALEKSRQLQSELVDEQVALKLKHEKMMMEARVKAQLQNENADAFDTMQRELEEKNVQLKEFNKVQAEIKRLEREKEALKSSVEVEVEEKLNQALIVEKQRIAKAEENKYEMAIRELQKKLDDQITMTNEMKRRQEQGSMQLQGEVQEIGIEEWLRSTFPLDTIVEVKKGARGADCHHIINSRQKENCGSIYYESKRTKEFGSGWIDKFKNDILEYGATIGILVTDVMPGGMKRMGLKDGVWVCSYDEFKGLCAVIREHIIALDLAAMSQENKGEKMVMLYDFLTSNEFRARVQGILDSHRQMNDDLQAEKRSLMHHWKKREKQLERVLINTSEIYSSIQGIAGKAIEPIEALEFPQPLGIGEESNLFQ